MRLFVFFISLLIVPVAFADYSKVIHDNNKQFTVEIEQSYILGDGDTKIDARNIALQHAKVKAAEMAGSYVKSERVIKDDEIKSETIKTISTALMQVGIKDERFSVIDSDKMQISLVVSATLDKRSILNKLGLLKKDRQKRKQMEQIEKENSRLQKELNSLNQKLAKLKQSQKSSGIQVKPRQELVKRRDEVFAEIEKNQNSISAIFKKGTLFAMAKQGSKDLEIAKDDIRTNVWNYIVNNAHVSMGDPEFRDNGNGTYNIEVNVDWNIDNKPMLVTLNRYFWGYRNKPIRLKSSKDADNVIEVGRFTNEKDKKKVPYADKLYDYYTSKSVVLRLSAGTYNGTIQFAGIDREFFGCNGNCYKVQTKPGNKVQFNQNPVVIENVPVKLLESLTAINAKVILQ